MREEFAKAMQVGFEMSLMGDLNYFLGLQIKQSNEGIFINQAKNTWDLLKRFGMDNSKPTSTPMSPSTIMEKHEKGKDVDQIKYRGLHVFEWTSSLLCLTASRPDIMFTVCMCY